MKHAFRSLARTPAFTFVALLTLALGIGANTAMFSVLRTLLYQPAPYPEAARLVRLFRTSPQSQSWPHSLPNLDDQRAQSQSLASLTGFSWWSYSLTEPGQPAERVGGIMASADLFATLGVQPLLGRAFTAEEQQPGRDGVAVISHELWTQRFGRAPDVIGRNLRIDGQPVTIIGVMPPSAAYPAFWGRMHLWRPLVKSSWREDRGTHWLNAIGRLRPGVSLAQAQAELETIAARLAQEHPLTNRSSGLRVVPLHETAMDDTGRRVTWLTFGLAGFVFLIACANLGSLQVARGAARARELAVRAALGASRAQLMHRVLAESLLLALCGGALGVLLSVWITEFLSRELHVGTEVTAAYPLALPVLGFATLSAAAAVALAGAVPAWLAARADVNAVLKQQSRGTTADPSRHRVRHTLIVVEMAFSLVLLAGAAFFIRGLDRLTARDPGWRTDGLVTGTVTLPESSYPTEPARRAFHELLLQRVTQLPGVEAAALATSLPIGTFGSSRRFAVEDRPDPPAGQEPLAYQTLVSADFFTALGVTLVEGRSFPATLRAEDPPVVLINESMARRLWPHESAVGKRIGNPDVGDRRWHEIIGIVRDVRYPGHVGAVDTPFQLYRPLVQEPWGYVTILLRSAHPETLAEPLRRAVAGLDADLPVADLRTVEEAVARAQQNFRVANLLLSGFAAVGLLLVVIGLYGVISGLVTQRTREFGIRLALGARPADLLRAVLRHGVTLALIGAAFGVAGAAALVHVLAALLPGLPGRDPLGFGLVLGLLILVALAASWWPARRATRIDPLIALRSE